MKTFTWKLHILINTRNFLFDEIVFLVSISKFSTDMGNKVHFASTFERICFHFPIFPKFSSSLFFENSQFWKCSNGNINTLFKWINVQIQSFKPFICHFSSSVSYRAIRYFKFPWVFHIFQFIQFCPFYSIQSPFFLVRFFLHFSRNGNAT